VVMCPTHTGYRTYLRPGEFPLAEGIAGTGVLEHGGTDPAFVCGLGTREMVLTTGATFLILNKEEHR
jgi:hypothetical protein